MTAFIAHYNTPNVTSAAVRSIDKNAKGIDRVVIFDSSDRDPFVAPETVSVGIDVVDNTSGKVIDFDEMLRGFPDKVARDARISNYGSAKHCRSVQWFIDNTDEPFMLVDSDVLMKGDIRDFVVDDAVWSGQVFSAFNDEMGLCPYRVLPFLSFINVPLVRDSGVRYYNGEFMEMLSNNLPNKHYDTGAWFYRDCEERGLKGHRIKSLDPYIEHLGSASFSRRKKNMADSWLERNRSLWAPDALTVQIG